jgi:hypothetical protein
MRKTLYAISALAIITAVSCTKKDEDINNVPDKGFVRFINASSSDRYNIYLDDFLYGNLYGDDTATFPNITTGAHTVKAQQIDVVGQGTLRQQQIYVNKDSTTTFVFP